MKPIALQLFSLREQAKQDLPGTLKLIADMGYDGVELAGLYGHEPKDVRKMLDDAGLRAAGSHCPLPGQDNFDQYVQDARTLGLTLVTAMKGGADFETPEKVAATAELFQAAAEKLAACDLTLTYHNHWWEMKQFGDRTGLDILYQNAPGLQAEIDVYWASDFQRLDPTDFVSRYADRMPQLHLKDGPLQRDCKHTALGEGKVDLPACVEAAETDVLQWLIVEIDSVEGDMVTAVKASLQYLVDQGLAKGR
jgi:sugar phosphate isomerase/epimerase